MRVGCRPFGALDEKRITTSHNRAMPARFFLPGLTPPARHLFSACPTSW
jgi:hypothetical protein